MSDLIDSNWIFTTKSNLLQYIVWVEDVKKKIQPFFRWKRQSIHQKDSGILGSHFEDYYSTPTHTLTFNWKENRNGTS
jgi:hypothetical protein